MLHRLSYPSYQIIISYDDTIDNNNIKRLINTIIIIHMIIIITSIPVSECLIISGAADKLVTQLSNTMKYWKTTLTAPGITLAEVHRLHIPWLFYLAGGNRHQGKKTKVGIKLCSSRTKTRDPPSGPVALLEYHSPKSTLTSLHNIITS